MRLPVNGFLLAVLCVVNPLSATVRTVGPGGDFATVQAALDAAVAAGGEQEIRVAARSFVESLSLVSNAPLSAIAVKGGWNSTFTAQTTSPTTISWSGSGVGVLAVSLTGAGTSVSLDHLRLQGGAGYALQAVAGGTTSLLVEDSFFQGSTAAGFEPVALTCQGCVRLRFAHNVVRNGHGTAAGGVARGAVVARAQGGLVELVGNEVTANTVDAGSSPDFAGFLFVDVSGGGRAEVLDNSLHDNLVDGSSLFLPASGVVAQSAGGGSQLLFDRNSVIDNLRTGGSGTPQILASASDGARTIVRNTLVRGDARGMEVFTSGGAALDLGNLTIDVGEAGVYATAGAATTSLYNSIILAPQPLGGFAGGFDAGDNFLAGDPQFVGRAARDYHLLPTSPARDVGSLAPPAGLGATDLDGQTRVRGAGVDLGAYEGAAPCAADPNTLCLGGRFTVTADWRRPTGQTGRGRAVALTEDTGYFWFFSFANVEMVVKALNGCGVNQRYWLFAGGLTNVQVTMRVTDVETGDVEVYENPLGQAFLPIQDTDAFATCP
jgi:hypothetical protein